MLMCMRWQMGVNGRGSDGETGVCLTQLQNIASWTQCKLYHLKHTSAASDQLTCHPHKVTWTFPFHRKMKSGLCVCVCAPSHSDCSIHHVIWGDFFNFTGNLGAHILYDLYFFRNTSTMKNLLQEKLQLQH